MLFMLDACALPVHTCIGITTIANLLLGCGSHNTDQKTHVLLNIQWKSGYDDENFLKLEPALMLLAGIHQTLL